MTAHPAPARKSAPLQPLKATPMASALLARLKAITIDDTVRAILLFFAGTLPLYYDLAVPEVSGDIRWTATLVAAALTSTLLAAKHLFSKQAALPNRQQPVLIWVILGLAIWAAVSLLDALNWMRGIILIKALYSQLLLIVAVYAVATPAFTRRLLWALVLPLIFTSFLGISQFHGWNDGSFAVALNQSWIFWPLTPLFWMLDSLSLWFAGVMGFANKDNMGFINLISNYFMQSAVPGSTFANKNLAGSWTGMMLPIALYLLITSKVWRGQAFASVLLAMGSLFFVYSRARASWLALFASLVTLAVLIAVVPAWRAAVKRHLDWSHLWWLLLPVVVLAKWGADVSPVQGAYAVDRTPAQQIEALANSSWDEIGGRLAYNLNSMAITKDYWFNGVGLGGFYIIYPPYSHAVVPTPPNSYSVMARPQRTHTDLMQAFDETGIPGGLLFAGLFIGAIAMAFRLAGNRAGGVAGTLIGSGAFACLALVTVFLNYKNMIQLSATQLACVAGLFVALSAALAYRCATQIKAVQAETEPADDIQLMGLMAGISVLTISVNALMDFPMQLPTAPAAAALVIGVILALYVRYRPTARVGVPFKVAVPLPARRVIWGVVLAVISVASIWGVRDAIAFRQGNVYLKQAMVRIFSGVNDDSTLQLITQAYAAYPRDPRIHEHMGVVIANYRGSIQLSMEDRIGRMEWVLQGDPWGANHLINTLGQYLALAESKQRAGDKVNADRLLVRADDLYARLQQAADFSQFTWGAGGLLRMLEGKNEEAVALFHRALAIDPSYAPAVAGLKVAQAKLSVSPVVVRDALTGGTGAVAP